MESAVRLSGVGKAYGVIEVLSDVDLVVAEGSFTSLLGPSGCGKTTLLNIIGGLDRPSCGEVRIGSDLVYSAETRVNVPTERRNVGYVFQSYALWPHMTVLQNVGYALKIRGLERAERDRRSREMMERLELEALADRYPFQLSGGQQQRVAIARAIVYRPRLLLLDEPLSNLDAQLRERARSWLKNIHQTFGLTTILVTHDQTEALSLSDYVVLLSRGRMEQSGTAAEIYERPRTAYAAEFVGGANIIQGRIEAGTSTESILVAAGGIRIAARLQEPMPDGSEAAIAIRPQKVRLLNGAAHSHDAGTVVPFSPKTVLYQGSGFEILGTTPVGDIRLLADRVPEHETRRSSCPSRNASAYGLRRHRGNAQKMMNIRKVEPFFVGRFLYARIETDDGLIGLGESGAWGHRRGECHRDPQVRRVSRRQGALVPSSTIGT